MKPTSVAGVSVVMRSFNEGKYITSTLQRLFEQDWHGAIELIVLDSGSTDDSLKIIEASNPATLIHIEKYIPGSVLNLGVKHANYEVVVFLNADAEPADAQWLNNLVQPLAAESQIAATFSRQLPREDCYEVFKRDYALGFAERKVSARGHFFSIVSAASRKSLLLQYPFREDVSHAEDHIWSMGLAKDGHTVEYVPASCVYHSHNYSVGQSFKRHYCDAYAIATTGQTDPGDVSVSPIHYISVFPKAVYGDFRYCAERRKISALPRCLITRAAQLLGRFRGTRSGLTAYREVQP